MVIGSHGVAFFYKRGTPVPQRGARDTFMYPILNPKPKPLNPKPLTLKSKPQTINPKAQSTNSKPQTPNPEALSVHRSRW